MAPRQDSVFDQMKSVYDLANKAGCYDAADIIRVWMQPSKATALQGIQQERNTARSEVARLTAEVEAMRAVVEAARALWLSWVEGSTTSQRVREHQSLGEALTALDAVPGDALAPRLPGVQNEMWRMANARIAELEGLLRDARDSFNGEGADAPTVVDRITAALEASGIDSSNVKGGE